MKNIAYILLALLLFGCAKENRWDCFKSYGAEKTEVRELAEFDAIYIDNRIDMIYRFDSTYRAEIRFGENIIQHIKTEVSEGNLTITNNSTCNWVRDLSKRPLVTIYAPEFSYMENRCSGDITFRDTLKTNSFEYDQWESNGIARFLIVSDFTRVSMHVGYCDMEISGRTEVAEFYSASAGRLMARGFLSPVTLSNNSSIQNMELSAIEYLYAEVNGSGSIFYSGDPDVIDSNISGSGTVAPL